MKRTLLALFLLTACSRAATKTTTTTTTSPVGAPAPKVLTEPVNDQLTGAATPQAAVEKFLTAVKGQDIQAMATIFGTSRGPSRDNMNRDELEKRLIILQCYFSHDKFRIVGEMLGEGGHKIVTAELTRGAVMRTPKFYLIPGPGNRYYLDNMEIAAVRDFCRGR